MDLLAPYKLDGPQNLPGFQVQVQVLKKTSANDCFPHRQQASSLSYTRTKNPWHATEYGQQNTDVATNSYLKQMIAAVFGLKWP